MKSLSSHRSQEAKMADDRLYSMIGGNEIYKKRILCLWILSMCKRRRITHTGVYTSIKSTKMKIITTIINVDLTFRAQLFKASLALGPNI